MKAHYYRISCFDVWGNTQDWEPNFSTKHDEYIVVPGNTHPRTLITLAKRMFGRGRYRHTKSEQGDTMYLRLNNTDLVVSIEFIDDVTESFDEWKDAIEFSCVVLDEEGSCSSIQSHGLDWTVQAEKTAFDAFASYFPLFGGLVEFYSDHVHATSLLLFSLTGCGSGLWEYKHEPKHWAYPYWQATESCKDRLEIIATRAPGSKFNLEVY